MLIDFKKPVTTEDIKSGIRSSPNFDKTASEWFDETQFFERRLSIAPFIAAGATLLAASTAFISMPQGSIISEVILPMLWMLIASISSQFFGGIFYVFSASRLRFSYTNRGNAERLFNKFCEKLVKSQIEEDVAYNRELQSKVPEVIIETNSLIELSNQLEDKAYVYMKIARVLVFLGFLLFALSIISPLIVVSSGRDFGWF